jgi:hypothetical protein
VVAEGCAGPLQLVDERVQVLHGYEIWPDQIVRQKAVGETEIEDVCASVRAFIRPARVVVSNGPGPIWLTASSLQVLLQRRRDIRADCFKFVQTSHHYL